MKRMLVIVLLCTPLALLAQKLPNFPVNDQNKITYQEVVNKDSLKKDLLYSAAKKWIIGAFNNAQNVIQEDNRDAGTLIGQGTYSKMVSAGMWGQNCTYYFTITFDCKDSKYRYTIGDVYVSTPIYGKIQAEEYVSNLINKKKVKPLDLAMVNDLNNTMLNLENEIKSGMNKNAIVDNW